MRPTSGTMNRVPVVAMRDGSASLQRLAAEANAAIKPSPALQKGAQIQIHGGTIPEESGQMISLVTGILSEANAVIRKRCCAQLLPGFSLADRRWRPAKVDAAVPLRSVAAGRDRSEASSCARRARSICSEMTG